MEVQILWIGTVIVYISYIFRILSVWVWTSIWKITGQYICVVMFIITYKFFLALSLWINPNVRVWDFRFDSFFQMNDIDATLFETNLDHLVMWSKYVIITTIHYPADPNIIFWRLRASHYTQKGKTGKLFLSVV